MRAGIVVDGKGQSRIWGDRIVIDWKEEAEKTYGFRVDVLRRGRGSWILETDLGLRLLKEYRGSVNPADNRRKACDLMVAGTLP